jgi:hypothetical protein
MTSADARAVASTYRRFASIEARGRSALYEAFALGVAEDQALLSRLAEMPPAKRQPNLLFAAARHALGLALNSRQFCNAVNARWAAVRAVMMERSTQTNEPGRCAVLLPILARLPMPLALIEVGAAAGLCLLPDRYAYEFNGEVLRGPHVSPEAPRFPCAVSGPLAIPTALPKVVWRAGLDLEPLDVNDASDVAWLETLVWPEQTNRLARLRAAIRVAQADPPPVTRGDLRQHLPTLAALAPRGATLVVFHTAVLAYVSDQRERQAFADSVKTIGAIWLANETPGVVPLVGAELSGDGRADRFVLSMNGVSVARTDPHGRSLEGLAPVPDRLRFRAERS